MYNKPDSLNLPNIDKEMLEFWERENIFEKSVEQRPADNSYVFYEGPPSANGKPGIHHVMARAIKDLFCRYHTLLGQRVDRKGGWDTHGLPIELSVEKELGITKEDIGTKISVDEYNAKCKETVMRYKNEWDDITRKMGYWVDLDHPYITYKNEYIETVWWLLKRLYDKDLLYKGYTIQPYSPAAGTGLSSHELNMPGAYQEVSDTSATALFKVVKNEQSAFLFENDDEDVRIAAWTTTPWTLPSNVALTVGPKIKYVKIKTLNPYTGAPQSVIVAEALVSKWFDAEEKKKGPKKPLILEQKNGITGADLEGVRYEQLLAFGNEIEPMLGYDGEFHNDAFRVVTADFVTTEDGTGIVHTAPSFGADDMKAGKANGIGALTLVDKQGKFKDSVGEFSNRYVKNYKDDPDFKNVDIDISIKLKTEGKALSVAKYGHNYPHCWRTDKPVLYYPLDSWFVKASAMKERMFELNKTINWKPAATGENRFGKWLENLQDWNLSRSRYWGIPLPIWRTTNGEKEKCIGSMGELKEEIEKANKALGLNQKLPKDLHRPYIDDVVLVSDDGPKGAGEPMRRELDLIDVWFDSGSMPYAQWGLDYEKMKAGDPQPFKSPFEVSFPANFIAEGVDQTRGWFYTLHAIGTMVFDSVAYKNVVSNGLVLDKNGLKMSKRLGNAVNPFETIEKFGADATRWYMISNSQPWDNLKFDIDGIGETQRKFFGTLYNTYSFFALYANIDNWQMNEQDVLPMSERSELDRWVISKLYSLVEDFRTAMDDYEPTRACRAVEDFVDRHLSNWFVRLSRRRFWKSSPPQPPQKGGSGAAPRFMTANPMSYELLKENAKRMRANPTDAEKLLWENLKGKNLGGFKFRQQHIIGDYIADFLCLQKNLIVEVDGKIHEKPEVKELDKQRTAWLSAHGYHVLRIKNEEILHQVEVALGKIEDKLNSLPDIPKGGGQAKSDGQTPPSWGAGGGDKRAAYETLFECLMVTAQLSACVAPFFADWLYRNLTEGIREKAKANNTPLRHESVHLTDLVERDDSKVDKALEQRMDYAQRISSLILSLRKKERLRVRQPLQKVMLPVLDERFIAHVDGVKDIILAEVNVKEIEYITDTSGVIKKRIKPNFKTLGRRLGKHMKFAAQAVGKFTQADIAALESSGKYTLDAEGEKYELTLEDFEITAEDVPGLLVATDGPLTVALDVTLSDELIAEGTARELVNRIQNIRKSSDFEVTDRITVRIEDHPKLQAAVAQYGDYVKGEVLADTLELASGVGGEKVEVFEDVVVGMEVAKAVSANGKEEVIINKKKDFISGLIADMESDRIERTESTTNTDKFAQAICAFSNDFPNHRMPGYLLIGVKDNGSLSGLKATDNLLTNLSGIRTNGNILPQPAFTVQKFSLDDGDIVVVEVSPNLHPPVRYKGKIWIRTGPSKSTANETEERRLIEKRTATAKSFDALPFSGSNVDDLSTNLFKLRYLPVAIDEDTLKANHRDTKEQMASLRMFDLLHGCPTNAGLLVFGKNPLFYLSGAYIQYVKFNGESLTDRVLAEKQFSGALIDSIPTLEDFLRFNLVTEKPVRQDSFQEVQFKSLPFWSIRELVLNAIMHRDYESNAPIRIYDFSDRVEIQNPGGLYGDVNQQNFPNVSDYRNPVIAEVMKNLGYVNRFNIGIANAKKLLAENGNPEPEFDLSLGNKFLVKIYK